MREHARLEDEGRSVKSVGVLLLIVGGLTAAIGLLLGTGCEVSGQYHGDNVDVQFGNTNAVVQTQ